MTIKKIMLFNQANENGFLSVGINVKYHPMPLIAVENMMGCNAASLYRVNAKYHPIPLLAVEVPLQTWISCKYTAALMSWGPHERWVNFQSGYTHSRGKFSYDIEKLTKSLYLRRLVQCDSWCLAGFLTLIIRDVFILEPLTCAWKCEFPQAPVCIWWQVDSLLPKISTFMKTWG